MNIPNQQIYIDHYGAENQYGIAMEECAELIKAASKMRRIAGVSVSAMEYNRYRDNLVEEIADVLICIEQLKLMADISNREISEYVQKKAERNRQRLEMEGAVYENS